MLCPAHCTQHCTYRLCCQLDIWSTLIICEMSCIWIHQELHYYSSACVFIWGKTARIQCDLIDIVGPVVVDSLNRISVKTNLRSNFGRFEWQLKSPSMSVHRYQ